jgi:hypothetical protein
VTGGASRVVVGGQSFGTWTSIVIQQSTVYFTTTSGVRGVPLAGGSAADVAPDLVGVDLAGDGAALFAAGSTQQSGLGIYRLESSQATLLTSVSKLGNEIGVDATDVYYEDDTSVMKVAKVGGAATFVAQSTDAYSLAVDDTYVYVGGGGVTRIPK